jgi:DNA helicase-2/ATP-dependent DNA helicase PcrA
MAFNAGDRIRHKVFGVGTVLEPDLTKASYLIQFDEMETPRSISFRVKMEKLTSAES